MSDGLLSDRQRAAVRDLKSLIADRSHSEGHIKQTYTTTAQSIETTFNQTRQALDEKFAVDEKSADKQYRKSVKKLEQEFETEYAQTERDYHNALARITSKCDSNKADTEKALQEAVWLTETVFEATETQPLEQFQNTRKGIEGKREELASIEEEATRSLKRYRQRKPLVEEAVEPPSDVTPPATLDEGLRSLEDYVDQAQAKLDELRSRFVPGLFQGPWPLAVVTLIVLVSLGVVAYIKQWNFEEALPSGLVAGAATTVVVLAMLYVIARSQIRRIFRPLSQIIAGGRFVAAHALKLAEGHRDAQRAELIQRRDHDLKKSHEKYEPILARIEQRREHHLNRINEKYPRVLQRLKIQRDTDLHKLTAEHQARVTDLRSTYQRESRELAERYEHDKRANQTKYETDWAALEQRWHDGTQRAFSEIEVVNLESARLFPGWNDNSWSNWHPPLEFSPIVRFGHMHVDVSKIDGGAPRDERLKLPGPMKFDVPALLAFPNLVSMTLRTAGDGRDEAIATLQTVMFRLLTTLPPGKVRFTIIDPVGLGQNFAGFMHLADYEGAFVTDKIWTEDRHIDQRLLDLTEHMENVIQKYLRNEYETIGDYNVDAGEIAEPFRFLVIANFPVNFSESAGRRLASIINSGARCGVYTLITVDARQSLPPGVQLSDIERNSATLVFDHETRRFVWNDPDFQVFPLELDAPPREEFVTEKLHIIGKAAKESTRVEVPFEVIAPDPQEMWSENTTNDLHVALGRAGATKLQYLTLGVGTSQHALVAGKTGSGKSTLLHALITNLSLWYPPDEVEFYLVDFKKGVEFKTYATHSLPHARAVAIESDREFGLSVLQRLDAELKHRGNVYRDLGVQDLAAYRRSEYAKTHPMPRTLLIIDEFQELFTEDDKIGQDAALLLDRLVRQGRAFGMHVLLGSQTLGGAYSLARSTINQMAVRIALQCSEADSYLILSDDNAAARLLSRPGEAIYNDASGMVEGNNPFQIVWLPDEKREECLQRVRTMAQRRSYHPSEPQIVFEGNVPAEIERNHLLEVLLQRDAWPMAANHNANGHTGGASAWLGEAIAIKDPTAAVFRRQSGNNLIIAGQREEAALAMMATSLISLAAQHAPSQAKFYIFDGSPVDSPEANYLAKVSANLPHSVQNVGYRDVPATINEISEELDRRTQSNESDAPAIYLIIYGLQRYRMLRQEDDFGMSSSFDPEAPPKPEKQFGNIIREGPHLGVHTLAWCDTVNNLNRSLDRQGLKEFEIRVLFQMGASDSSNLIDSPLASKLGLHRALFYSEEQGQVEKFRPYALPDEEWFAVAAKKLASRAGAAQPTPS